MISMDNSDKEKEVEETLLSDVVDFGFDFFAIWQHSMEKSKQKLKEDYDHVGKIITCHLVIENLINNALIAHSNFSEEKIKDARLTFSQKLKLLPTENKAFEYAVPAIKELNYVRNSIAHQLSFDIEKANTPKIDALLSIIVTQKDNTVQPLAERIETFTIGCISLFSMHSHEINEHMARFKSKHPVVYENLIETFNPQIISEFLKGEE